MSFILSDEPGTAFNPVDAGAIQLVACTERVEHAEPPVSRCDYQDSTAPMYRATVEITVYEARTAERVAEPIRLPGEDLSCPGTVRFTDVPTVYSTATPEQFKSVLSGVVQGS